MALFVNLETLELRNKVVYSWFSVLIFSAGPRHHSTQYQSVVERGFLTQLWDVLATQVCAPDWVTAESFVIEMLSGSYSVLSIQQATVNKQDLFYNFWLFHSLPSKSQDNHITITQRQAET